MKVRAAFLLPLLAVVSCSQTGGEYALSEEESWSAFSGLAGLAKDADPGTGTYACRFEGTVSISTLVETGERGDSSWTSGRWVLEPSGCRMIEISPEVSLWGGSVTFETETAVTGGGGGRIRISMDGHVNWSRSETVGSVCPVYLDFESSFGADDAGGGFQGSADAEVCGRGGLAVPLSMFPRGDVEARTSAVEAKLTS